jgi:hypothetical protein
MFPAMSKRHSELLQTYSNNEGNTERIWKAACEVWKSCSSSMICRAFIHAYRIMAKIVEHEGHNHWLVDGTPHCNVRRDYVDTEHGISPRINHCPHHYWYVTNPPPYGSNRAIYHVFLVLKLIIYIYSSFLNFNLLLTTILHLITY